MINDVLAETQKRMKTSLDSFGRELQHIRTGRANIAILDDIRVDYYGTMTPLNQLASLSAPEPQMLLIQPYDKSSIGAIERAIMESDLGLNPQNDGNVIRIPIPELTEERRKELVKVVNKHAEEAKTAIRQIRRDANEQVKKLEKDKEISQDDEHRGYERVQELTDDFCKRVDDLAEHKRQELLEI